MLYCIFDPAYPAEYIGCGNLINEDGFLLMRRNLDCFVFLVMCQGTLHIVQNDIPFDIHENETFLLLPHTTHYGYKKSEGFISYYWVHFYITDPKYTITNKNPMLWYHRQTDGAAPPVSYNSRRYPPIILPEFSRLSPEKRSHLLFSQLLDMAKRDNYLPTWRCNCALNLLLADYTKEFLNMFSHNDNKLPGNVKSILEWIRVNCAQNITVLSIAKHFNYHPAYLAALLKKHTGNTASYHIMRFRINMAKNLLTTPTPKISTNEISYMCGFNDAKYFMRVFKKMEGMTPTQYRNTFSEKIQNRL